MINNLVESYESNGNLNKNDTVMPVDENIKLDNLIKDGEQMIDSQPNENESHHLNPPSEKNTKDGKVIATSGPSEEIKKEDVEMTVQNVMEGHFLDKSPPNFELAMIHRKANMVKNLNLAKVNKQSFTNKDEFCPC